MIVDVRSGDDFVGLRDFDEFEQTALNGFRGAHGRAEERHAGGGFFRGRPVGIDVVDRRRNLAGRAATKIREGLLDRGEKVARFSVGFRDDHVEAEHGVRTLELPGWLEVCAIKVMCLHHVGGREMRGKCKGQTELGRQVAR